MPTKPSDTDSTAGRRGAGGVVRSRTGCWTCRVKKVKCDETQPQCLRCKRLRLLCHYGPRPGTATTEQRSVAPGDKSRIGDGSSGSSSSSSNSGHGSNIGIGRRPGRPGQMTLQLAEFTQSASAVALTSVDHEAIRHYRTTMSRQLHTKNPDFSIYSVMFTVAEREPMAMHALLALASRSIEFHRPNAGPNQVVRHQNWSHLAHYSSALKELTKELAKADEGHDAFNFDSCFTTMLLMLLYEQNYGDPDRVGLAHHLHGAAMVLRHRGQHIKGELEKQRFATPSAVSRRANPTGFSLWSARVIMYVSLADSTAATYGLGGEFSQVLSDLLGASGPLIFTTLNTFSVPLFRTVWGGAYPQSQLIDDIENHSLMEMRLLLSETRYLLARIPFAAGPEKREEAIERAKQAIQLLAYKYQEELNVADTLLPTTDNSHRLVANMRFVIPYYHVSVIQFATLTGAKAEVFGHVEPKAHMRSIMALARPAYRHSSYVAVLRIAWPLFVVAMETDDVKDREWILARFAHMAGFDKNIRGAYEFLCTYEPQPGATAPWLYPQKWFRSNDGSIFII